MQIRGTVVHGKGEARALGYPTANLEYSSKESIKSGIWTCWMMVDDERHEGLAVVGMWQLKGGEPSLEVHVLDFDQDLYGQSVEVELGEYLRPSAKFESIEKLKQQIQDDVVLARSKFSQK